MKLTRLCGAGLFIVASLAAVSLHGAASAASPPPGIVFLHLRFETDSVTLLNLRIRPGHLKMPRSQTLRRPLQYVVTTSAGMQLFKGDCEDPRLERLEYEDPRHPGKLKSLVVHRTSAECILRLPYRADAREVVFREHASHPGSALRVSAPSHLLGRIRLPPLPHPVR